MSAADGYSPTERVRRPHRVWKSPKCTKSAARMASVAKMLVPVKNTRGGISKASMILNDATPHMEVDPETYEVRADGELLVCEPATELPLAQRYFLF